MGCEKEQSVALISRRNQAGRGLRSSNRALDRGKLVKQVYLLIYRDSSLYGWEDLEPRRKKGQDLERDFSYSTVLAYRVA